MHRFVELKKNDHWFLKGVAGATALKGALSCVHVLSVIRDTFNNWEEAETATAVAEMQCQKEEEVDPMDQIDLIPSNDHGKFFRKKKQ